ncbi:NAD(+) kinase [Coxiella endosymbiont of Amblyomma nuttalli]|uniref:NAD(+) kinase n=1 Tax=Coxiella endosymbiont of Amblyomma nuttalli TaxID=2749996 RepID=UPI001BA5A7E4|nr:NAD(+) kinase [Coxiella endosymbiont of Amblyomma nuttalli]QTS83975.1 putative inorganic polyphosphate/ATP-NAD kinase [Coxiella endosymbiont of Amblyomma nuttalli]
MLKNIMNKPLFHRIALMGREGVEGVPETLSALTNYLLSLKKEVNLEKNSAHMIKTHQLPIVSIEQLKEKIDLLIAVGGDGSLLNAAHIAVPQGLPVLGINRGRLGFLTDIPSNEFNKIETILKGHYKEEIRFLLDMRAKHDNKVITRGVAINDVVLLPGDIAKMIEFDIYINDVFVCHQRADGLIITTPTGSTAYALSGGGPILHPQLDAVALVPMFPHTLSSRPIVIDGDSQIKINISRENDVSPYVSYDGQPRTPLLPEGSIYISKYQHPLRLIHPRNYNYYDILRRKLNWEKHTSKI